MPTVRSAVWLGIVALVAAASFGLLVVLPYYVNDLDRFPLADVAIGSHDRKDLWPTTILYIGGWLHLFGVLSTVFAPSTLLCVAFTCGFSSGWAITRRAWSVAAVHAVVVACLVATAWFFRPFAQALAGWQMD